MHRVDTHVGLRKLTHERELEHDGFFAEMREVEVRVLAVLVRNAATGFELLDDRPRDHVARPKLSLVPDTVVVVDEEAGAFAVAQIAALTASRFGDQDARARQTRRVILDKFHVFQTHTRAISQRHPVAGLDHAVGRKRENLAGSSGSDHDRSCERSLHLPGANVEHGNATGAPVLD